MCRSSLPPCLGGGLSCSLLHVVGWLTCELPAVLLLPLISQQWRTVIPDACTVSSRFYVGSGDPNPDHQASTHGAIFPAPKVLRKIKGSAPSYFTASVKTAKEGQQICVTGTWLESFRDLSFGVENSTRGAEAPPILFRSFKKKFYVVPNSFERSRETILHFRYFQKWRGGERKVRIHYIHLRHDVCTHCVTVCSCGLSRLLRSSLLASRLWFASKVLILKLTLVVNV